MAVDVSSTIHIIAEVAGDAASPLAGKGSFGNKPKKKDARLKIAALGINLAVKSIVKWAGVAGLLGASKVISGAMTGIFRIIGAAVDMVLMPFIPALVKGLEIFTKVVAFLANYEGGASWAEAWAGIKNWWNSEWEEGGLWGIIKDILLAVSGVTLITALMVGAISQKAGWWILKNTFGRFGFFTKAAIKEILKGALPGPRGRSPSIVKRAASKLSTLALAASNLFRSFWATGAYFVKSNMIKWFGFIADLAPIKKTKGAWKKFLKFGRIIWPALSRLIVMIGGGALIAALAAVGWPALIIGLLIAGAIVGGIWIVNKINEMGGIKAILRAYIIDPWNRNTPDVSNLNMFQFVQWGQDVFSAAMNPGRLELSPGT